MTGAGLPPIALEAVLKLLAIGQDSAKTKKTVKAAGKPNLRLELTPDAASFALPLRAANTRTVSRAAQRRRPGMQKPSTSRPNAEGAESC
jgi:hypothetical protein